MAWDNSDTILGSHGLARIARDVQLTCLDIGARGQFNPDLLPLAPLVDGIGFEPDLSECARLNNAAARRPGRWRSLRFIPTALAETNGSRTLYVCRSRGCSSLYQADLEMANAFARADLFSPDGTVSVPTMPLDLAAETFGFMDAAFIKLDIQGAELEVLRSGPRLLSSTVLGIRTEVEFSPLYSGQPLLSDVEMHLREHNFVPMGFLELHHWRRSTRSKHPELAAGPIPYSRGQLMHGDILFFRNPASLPDDTPLAVEALIKAAVLALAYEYVDHAGAILTRPAVADHLVSTYGLAPHPILSEVSHFLAHRYRRRAWTQTLAKFVRRGPRLGRRFLTASYVALRPT